MIKISKERLLETIELNPSSLIGKNIMLKSTDLDSVEIVDVNLKCTYIKINKSGIEFKWINVNELEDEILFNSFGFTDFPTVTVKTLIRSIK